MAEAEAGCGQTAVGIPMGAPAGHPAVATGAGMPVGHPAGIPKTGRPPRRPPRGHPDGAPAPRRRALGRLPSRRRARPRSPTRSARASRRRGSSRGRSRARCNLSCVHCRAAAEFGHYHGELKLDEIKATIDDIVTITNPIIILTGGEPLMRPDIWEIVDYAQEKGAMPVIGTNATLITDEIAQKMADHKIPRITVSVDFPTAAEHDEFRQQEGCFDKTIEGIKIAKRHGIGVQINTTVTTRNVRHARGRCTRSPSRSAWTRSTSSCSCRPAAARSCSPRSCRRPSTRRRSSGRTSGRRPRRCTSSRPTRRTTTASSGRRRRPRARRSRARSTGSTR